MEQPKFTNKICHKHGEQEFVLEGRGYYRCKKCRSERVSQTRRNNKRKLVELYGCKCSICSYDKFIGALHFHHLDPSKKEFALGEGGIAFSLKRMKEEAKKCILVCANCHAEIENNNYLNKKKARDSQGVRAFC